MKIKLVTLEGCSRCERTKELFNKERIRYAFTSCEEDPQNCDNLEGLIDEIAYPMILLTNSSDTIFEILYITDSYTKLKSGARNKEGILCIPNHSIDNMLLYVKNKLNLNK